MPETPLISIVLPVHNEEQWLKQCFESLLGQTYQSLEIVFIDDASTDTSWSVIQGLQKDFSEKVLSFHFEKNAGEGAARNKGIALARGEYIIETDADAVFPPDFVTKLLAAYGESSADGLSLGYLKVHPNKKGVLANYWRAKRHISKMLRDAGNKEAVASMFFFKKADAEKIGGYDAHVPSGTDFDFGMRARQHGMTIAPASEVFFYHADVTNWRLFYKRLFNAARYDMPIKKRWGRWLTPRQIAIQSVQASVATILLIIGLGGIVYPPLFLAWALLFFIEGILPLIFHKETRMIATICTERNYWLTLLLLPVITFFRIRASNYGKMYAVLFPAKTSQSVTFDV